MIVAKCRVCGHGFFPKPLLRFENLPAVAQHLPTARTLGSDRGVDLNVLQCSGCGLVQLDGRPVPYYREVIRAAAISREMTRFRRRQFEAFIRRHSLQSRKIVEIGCGRGEFLSILHPLRVKAHGVEQSREAVAACRCQGLRVSRGFVASPTDRLPHAPFDAFLILNFLEHLPDPNSTLMGIRNNLSENAVGLVEVPNFDMILRKKLFAEFTTDHRFYFTRDTLATTLRTNGFEVIDCVETWHDYILSATVARRAATDVSTLAARQARLRRAAAAWLRRFRPKRVAVWGAGHQALAFLAIAGLAPRIRYVVDSAPFKQGRFTPATHLPIVSPEALSSDPVDALLILAASYSDEVARLVRQRHGRQMRVCILRDHGLELVI